MSAIGGLFVVVSEKDKNRRRGARVPMNVALSEGDPRATTPVSDLSVTGVFVHTEERLPLGSDIELRFTVFPDEPVLFECQGRVVRHGDDPPGMGVEFVRLDGSNKEVLHEILIRHEAQRRRNPLPATHDRLRTHGLVARVLETRDA